MYKINEYELLKKEIQEKIDNKKLNPDEDGSYKIGYRFTKCGKRYYSRGLTADALAQDLLRKRNESIAKEERKRTLDRRFDQVSIDWFETNIKGRSLGENNIRNTKSILNKHIIPQFGYNDISSVQNKDLQNFLNELSTCYSKDHVLKIKNTLEAIFVFAAANDLIGKLPTIGLKMPKCVKKSTNKKDPVSSDEFLLALRACKNDLQMLTILEILFVYGMRDVELNNLRWENINFEKKYIHITHSKYTGAITTRDDNICMRYLPLCDTVAKSLKALKEKNKIVDQSEYIFKRRKSNKPLTTKALDGYFKTLMRDMDILNGAKVFNNKIIESSNIRYFTPYAFRKGVTTTLDSMNMIPAITQKFIGHAPSNVKDRYYSRMDFEQHLRPAFQPYLETAERNLINILELSKR